MADRLVRPSKIYLVRKDDGDREDYWPASAHWTWAGAVQGLKDLANRYEVDYSSVVFPAKPPTGKDFFSIPSYSGEMFIAVMEVG